MHDRVGGQKLSFRQAAEIASSSCLAPTRRINQFKYAQGLRHASITSIPAPIL